MLETWVKDRYASSAFNTCEHTPLPMMHGDSLRIILKPEAVPTAIHTPIPVPAHWRAQVKADLDRDVALGVIEPVPIGTPTTWCHRMVIVPKKDGTPRRTVDLQSLNGASVRQTHHVDSPFRQASRVPPGMFKTILDAWNGYHSVLLDSESREATTFITPWGRYRYRTAPQGYLAAGDGYTARFDRIIADVPNVTKCVDDSLLWTSSIEESVHQTCRYLELCCRNGITFNPRKFHLARAEVEFVGFKLTQSGIGPSDQFLQSIRDFPQPTDITGVRSWFGLINQASYAFSMTSVMLPFRELLKPGRPFYWDSQLEILFQQSKEVILDGIKKGVRCFEAGRTTCLSTDWSKDGLGFLLTQKHCDCQPVSPSCCQSGWQLVFAGSRFTSSAESRYAPVEGEALAVPDALEKCKYFVLGCPRLIVATDHKPLTKILGDRKLEHIGNPRLLHIKEKCLMFHFQIVHVPGKWHQGPDATPRWPVAASPQVDEDSSMPLSSDMTTTADETLRAATVGALRSQDQLQAITWERVSAAVTADREMVDLLATIRRGFPATRTQLPPNMREFWKVREGLTTLDSVPLYKQRIVVPKALRAEVLEALHSAHQGVAGMKARAEVTVYWPGMSAAIVQRRDHCRTCNTHSPSQPHAPPTLTNPPQYPFQQICADYCSVGGIQYLILVDRYSGWLSVIHCGSTTESADELVACLRDYFQTYGVPEELASDGGPTFLASKTQYFLRSWGVYHRLSSVAFPHSNSRAEVAVKSAKRLIRDNTGPKGRLSTDHFARALLEHRNTPDPDTGLSPAHVIYGRQIRDFIPAHPGQYRPRKEWILTAHDREIALAKRHCREVEKLSEHVKQLHPLCVGEHVRVQNQMGPRPLLWEKTGIVIEARDFDQYVVKMDGSGRCSPRNRKFLRKIQPVMSMSGHGVGTTPHHPRNGYPPLNGVPPTPLPVPRLPNSSLGTNPVSSTGPNQIQSVDTSVSPSPSSLAISSPSRDQRDLSPPEVLQSLPGDTATHPDVSGSPAQTSASRSWPSKPRRSNAEPASSTSAESAVPWHSPPVPHFVISALHYLISA